MVNTSSKAVARLREQLIHSCFQLGIGFRVLVNTDKSGKATFSIKIDKQHQTDEVIGSSGVKVFLDPSSAAQIRQFQLDYRDGPGGGFFLKRRQEAKIG